MVAPSIWTDKCYVSISKLSTGATTSAHAEYGNKTGDITIGGGESGLEIINVNTGDIPKLNRQEPFEITFDNIVPIYANNFRGLKEGGTGSSGLVQVTAGTDRGKFRVAMLWTDQGSPTSGVQAISSGSYARRCVVKDAYLTGMEENWEAGGVLSGTLTFRVPAVNESGAGNVLWQSVDGTSTMGSLSAYTGGNFGNS